MPTIDSKNRRIRYNILLWGPCPTATDAGILSLYDTVTYGKRSTLQVIKTWGGPTLCFEYEPADAGDVLGYSEGCFVTTCPVHPVYGSTKNFIFSCIDGVIYFDKGNYSRIHEYDVNDKFSNSAHLEIESENTILFE
jgi:hypothetical protein